MAAALANGFINANLIRSSNIIFYDIITKKSTELSNNLKATSVTSVASALEYSDIIIFAVKPQDIKELLTQVAPEVKERHFFISILAGVTISFIESLIGGKPRVVRVIPNTPVLVGQGASALARGQYATANDLDVALILFRSSGIAIDVEENKLDAVTGLSGSGPAYFFYLMEAMIDAGCQAGLNREVATALTLQTAMGSVQLANESNDSLTKLREKVTSKDGTTAAGLSVMIDGNLADLIKSCINAGIERSKELGLNKKT